MGVVHRRAGEHRWEGVEPAAYHDPALSGVRRHELVAGRDVEVRYFHVPPGGRTARERHPHEHGVVILSGHALVTLGDERHELGPGDAVHVEGDEPHCFEARPDEPLGFLCVVPSQRAPTDTR